MLLPLLAACASAAPPAPAATSAPAAAATVAPKAAAPTAAPTTAPSGKPKVLKMARNAEPFSPFIPWQIDDNPALFISVNVYDSLLRMTPDGQNVQAGLATKWTPAS